MLKIFSSSRQLLATASPLSAAILLVACGGGGGGTTTTATATAAAPSSIAALPDPVSPVTDPGIAQASSMSVALAASFTNDQQALNSTLAVAAAPSMAALTSGNYYVDSKIGDDTNDGRSSTAGTAGVGPWKTLARVTAASLVPGDSVRLTCGSVWNETLKLTASGAPGKPLVVSSFPGSCSNPPVIDGSVAVADNAWTVQQGGIYRTPLATEPLLLTAAGGPMTVAHFPNRGFDSTLPSSMFLRNAADSDTSTVNGKSVSTYLVSGADLPAGKVTAGTKVRIRSAAWTIDETTVSSVNGTRIALTAPTSYPLKAGWGFYFFGQAWMLDSPGEWFYDSNAKVLYAWMPDSGAPRSVFSSKLAVGIDLTSLKYITLNNLSIKLVGTGIAMTGSTGVIAQYLSIRDTASVGVDAARGTSNAVSYSTLLRTGGDAISAPDATGMTVLNNNINQSGVLMSGDTVVSLPSRSHAAIRPGLQAQVSGNSVVDTGYTGIWPAAGTTVAGNYVRGACSVLDDCAGIYASGGNHNSFITGNFVDHSRGSIDGKTNVTPARTQAQGIYLDEGASGIVVDGNTVVDADNGIHLHIAANNVIRNNRLYGNRINQLWLQETSNKLRVTGDVFGNTISNNQFVPTSPTSRGFLLETMIVNSELFAQLDWNRYFDRTFARVGSDANPTTLTDYTFVDWKAARKADGTPRSQDPNGHGASEVLLASNLVSGANIVPNGNLANDYVGWSAYNTTAPFGSLTRESCAAGYCAHYTAGGSAGLISSPNFSIVAGQWYRFNVDLKTARDGQTVNMVVRRGGGGGNGFEGLMGTSTTVTAATAWKRYSFTFQATKTVNAADLVTGDFGARVDIQQVMPGDAVYVGNLAIVPTVAATVSTRTDLLKNTSAAAIQVACPVASTTPALCASYARLTDDTPVTWPYALAPRSSEIIYTRDVGLVDSDGDGIADSQDSCPGTPRGLQVNASGCAISQ